MKLDYRGMLFGVAVLLTGVISGPCQAAASNYFKGKTITYIVATHPGGGYDAYGRLIAKYMEKYLPGSTIIVKNVPGAGHIIGCNEIYNSTPNGLTIGTFNTGLIYAQLVGKRGINFDLSKMSWIGKAASDPRVMIARNGSGLKTVQDLENSQQAWKLTANGPGSADYNETTMLSEVMHWNIKLLLGYRGNEGQMAMRRGETDGMLGSRSSLSDFVQNGYGHYVFEIGGTPPANVPLLSSEIKSSNTKANRIVALIRSQADLARLTAGPPGIPKARLAQLRDAYRKATQDPALLAQAKKMGRPIDPAYGAEVAKRVNDALDQPPAIKQMLKQLLSK